MPNRRSYRIELHQPKRKQVLATGLGVKPHFRSLDLYLSRLRHDGKAGVLVLIDMETGARVAQRHVLTTNSRGSSA